jgi:hypothetical protein
VQQHSSLNPINLPTTLQQQLAAVQQPGLQQREQQAPVL